MSDGFHVIDFAVVAAPLPQVAIALSEATNELAAKADAEAAPAPGFLSRLMGRAKPALPERAAFRVSEGAILGQAPLARPDEGVLHADLIDGPFRLTGPVGPDQSTLVEFREGDAGHSPLAAALSHALGQVEVFYFRVSGDAHPGGEFMFQIYRDGSATRSLGAISTMGAEPSADWQRIDSGIPHPIETGLLSESDTDGAGTMTPADQATLLTALGVDPDHLFEAIPDGALWLALRRGEGEADLETLQDAYAQTPVQAPPAEESEAADTATWEEEVTLLLLEAVADALPENEQIAWLEELTQKLEKGEIDSALSEANALLAQGSRPIEDRAAAAARLKDLLHPRT